jgi:methylaspartate mutase epsilon subunit
VAIDVANKRLDEDVFTRMRKSALALWPTGKEVDLDEAVEYQRRLPASKSFLDAVRRLRREGTTVVFPRGGTPILEDQISLARRMEQLDIPLIPVTTDSYTRFLRLDKAEEGLKESVRVGKPMLNGYPLINHGVRGTRKLVESVERGAFNPRLSRLCYPLASEIALASGMTGLALSAFVTFGAYEKDSALEDSILQCQYVARLMGYYADKGVIITADHHGWIPTCVFPLSVNLATTICDALIAAEQGVKSVIPLVHSMGNIAQDLAWIRVTPRLLREYLDRFGFDDVIIPGVFGAQTPLYPMPRGVGPAFGYLNYTAILAALARVESVFLRTIDEASGVPGEEAHAVSYESANWLFHIIREQNIEFDVAGIDEEEAIAEMEIRAILERLLEMGDGDIVRGSVKGVEAGVLDSFFCPNKHVRDLATGVKDSQGAVRYADFGNLPIPEEAKEFHRRKVAERSRREDRQMDYNVAIEDFWAFSKGRLIGVPKGQ